MAASIFTKLNLSAFSFIGKFFKEMYSDSDSDFCQYWEGKDAMPVYTVLQVPRNQAGLQRMTFHMFWGVTQLLQQVISSVTCSCCEYQVK